jgi:hypothetical protein
VSVCREQLGSHWTEFDLILYLSFSKHLSRKFKFHLKPTRITCTLNEDVVTFMTTSRLILLRIRHASSKTCIENKSTYFMSNFFPKIVPFVRQRRKYGGAREAASDNMAAR